MEFPDLGKHCSLAECQRLDFLPIKCSSCNKIFCSEHYLFQQHHCATREDHQVPICPLCNKPVPMAVGESPDAKVSEHIDQNCNSKQEKIFKNKCSVATCKKKELMPLRCEQCHHNHCLKHRHPLDHQCPGPSGRPVPASTSSSSFTIPSFNSIARKSRNAFESMRNNIAPRGASAGQIPRAVSQPISVRSHPGNIASLQGDLTEEEALTIALQESMMETNSTGTNRPRDTPDKCFVA